MDKLWLLRFNFHKPEESSNENNMENKFARFLRNTGPARFFLPMGVLALVFGVLKTVKAFQKSKALDQMPKAPTADFEGFKQAPGVRELYCRHDGVTLKRTPTTWRTSSSRSSPSPRPSRWLWSKQAASKIGGPPSRPADFLFHQ